MTRYGFYSETAAKQFGYQVYKTPSGGEVMTTCVSTHPDAPEYAFSDKRCVGEVTDYVRTVKSDMERLFGDFKKNTNQYE